VNHNLFLVLTVIFGLTLSGWTLADNAHDRGYRAFIGLWQAIDSFDGSTQYLSITCTPKSSCDVRLNDTALRNVESSRDATKQIRTGSP
jgi:hypothetical protein